MISPVQFWNWFEKNSAKYFFLNQIDDKVERETILDEFLSHLHQYCDKLFFEIGGHQDEKQDLIITAEGNTKYFAKVEELVRQAPKLTDWNIIAFKPAVNEGFCIERNGVAIDPKDAWFMPLESKSRPGMLGLRIYLSHYEPSQKREFLNTTYLVMDSLLGERSNALDIHHIDLAPLPDQPDEQGLIRLSEVAQYVKWKKEKKS